MSGPYRTPSEPQADDEDDEEKRPVATELGVLQSSHARDSPLGLAAEITGRWYQLDLHENGMVLQARNKKAIPFDEVDAVHFEPGLIAGPPTIILVTFDGIRTAIPSDVRDLDRIIEAINRKVTQPIAARAKEALTRGERLVFGPLVLELDGIVLKGDSLSWESLLFVDAERDSFVFHARGPRGRFGWARLVDIPHPSALLDVLRLRTTVNLCGLRLTAEQAG